jgi:hypothetical protein
MTPRSPFFRKTGRTGHSLLENDRIFILAPRPPICYSFVPSRIIKREQYMHVKRCVFIIALLSIMLLFSAISFAQSPAELTEQGNSLLKKDDVKGALESYNAAIEADPIVKDPGVRFSPKDGGPCLNNL